MRICIICWDAEAADDSKQCLTCQQIDPYGHKDFGWAQPGLPKMADDLTPALMHVLDALAAAEDAAET